MHPRIFLYAGLLIAAFPLWGVSQYLIPFFAIDDPIVRRQYLEPISMIGMYSWPVWLGLAGYSVIKWQQFSRIELFIAWVPMILFISVYIVVLTR